MILRLQLVALRHKLTSQLQAHLVILLLLDETFLVDGLQAIEVHLFLCVNILLAKLLTE